MWKLERINFQGMVIEESFHPSGDAAKARARRQQVLKEQAFDFKIYDPGETLWSVGRMKRCNGWEKMVWR